MSLILTLDMGIADDAISVEAASIAKVIDN